jgi:hypothetical protein
MKLVMVSLVKTRFTGLGIQWLASHFHRLGDENGTREPSTGGHRRPSQRRNQRRQ